MLQPCSSLYHPSFRAFHFLIAIFYVTCSIQGKNYYARTISAVNRDWTSA